MNPAGLHAPQDELLDITVIHGDGTTTAAKKRLSWLSSIVSFFDDLTRRVPAQGWRAAPPPSAAAALSHPASYQLGF